MQGRIGVAIAVIAVGLWVPEPASGARVSTHPVGAHDLENVFYTAGPGEKNDVIASTDGTTVTIHDPGAHIHGDDGCVARGRHTATCDVDGFAGINYDLRGDDDVGRITGSRIALELAEGGPGRDLLVGGKKVDRFNGGRGPDVIEGKGTFDTIYYTGRTDPIHVTLGDGKRNEGGPRDGALRDRLAGIENVVGGAAGDLLVGNGHENRLLGGPGRDLLRGEGDFDWLGGGTGRDTAYGGDVGDIFESSAGDDDTFGGPGHDLFEGGTPNSGADRFMGGPGNDLADYHVGHVRLSLDGKANDGACANPACTSSNEGDNLLSITKLVTTYGHDVLIGSSHDEVFEPFPGADTVRAKGGDDVVYLEADDDVDNVDCGPGEDRILETPDPFDITQNCE